MLDRPVRAGDWTEAWLSGFRRVRTTARTLYPMLVPDPYGGVDGVTLRVPTLRDQRRIAHFEDDGYKVRWLMKQLSEGQRVPARVFLARPVMGQTDEPWDLELWVAEHKAACLEHCRRLMLDYPAEPQA